MDLITRCPQCNATFPVTPEELQLRKGYIRCISCAHIFDGYEAIVPSAPKPAAGRARSAAPTKIEPIVPGPPPVRPRKHPDAQTRQHPDYQARQHPETQDRRRRDSHAHDHDAPSHSVASAPVLPIPVRARPEFTVSRNAPPTNAAPAPEAIEPRSAERAPVESGPTERSPIAREPVVRLSTDSGAPDHGPNDRGAAAGVPVVRVRAERRPAERGPADREPTVREPTVREPTVREPTVREPTVREPSLGVTSLRGGSSREPSLPDRTWNEPVSSEPVFRFRDRPPVQDDTPGHHLAGDDASHTALVPTVRVGRSTPLESRPLESRPDIEPVYVEPRATARRPEPIDNATFTDDFRGRLRGLGHLFWGALALIGLAILCAQAVYVYRVQIATQLPTLRPVLEQACEALDCTVAYPRRIDEIAIVASSLRARPKTGNAAANEPDTLVLQLTMRNNYDRAQQWPTLVLELKDFSGTVVAKKNLAPREYLSSSEAELPFAASSEAVIGVPITLDGIKINGYQLSKFFP